MRNQKMARGEAHGAPKKFHHLEIREGEGGGHVVTHHFESYEHRPEEHVFGAEEGGKALEHVASAANIGASGGDGKPEHSKQIEEEEGE